MTDSVAVFPPGFRVLDTNGAPVAGAVIRFFVAATTTPLTVYSDNALATALGIAVSCDSSGAPVTASNTKTLIYTGSAAYKVTIEDATGYLVPGMSFDNVKGAVVSSTGGSGGGLIKIPVASSAALTTLTLGDLGILQTVNSASGDVRVVLPDAVASYTQATNTVMVKKSGTPGTVTIVGTGGQLVEGRTSFVLTSDADTVILASNGAGWIVVSADKGYTDGGVPIQIAAQRAAPPATAVAGARYIIATTPTDAWLGKTIGTIVQNDNVGGYVYITLPADCGWLAYVQAEKTLYQYRDTAWVALSNITAPASAKRPTAVFQQAVASGTAGGNNVATAWTALPMNTAVTNTIVGASLSSGSIVLPAGSYNIDALQPLYSTGLSRIRLRNAASTIILYGESVAVSSGGLTVNATLSGVLDLPTADTVTLEYYCNIVAGVTAALGAAHGIAGVNEIYGSIKIMDQASVQGPQGPPGASYQAIPNVQTVAAYSISPNDASRLVTRTNAGAMADILPQAGVSSSFLNGYWFEYQNRGAGVATLTPTVSTIDGVAALVFQPGQGARIFSDGTNYFTGRGRGVQGPAAVAVAGNVAVYSGTSGQIVADGGTPSAFLAGAVAKGGMTLANGLNSNITRTAGFRSYRIAGPTAVFSVGGFTGGTDGQELRIYNTVAFAMTIVNADASSTAANRISTLTGANVVLRAGTSFASFEYDATQSLWILTGTN